MEAVLAVCMGVGLAAACGFRVFVPMLVACIALRSGHIGVAASHTWLASDAALLLLITATILEVVAYYVPWLDNMLDTVTTPASIVAGTLLVASFITTTSPMLKWSLALIAGGGAAGVVQTGTVLVRGASSATTAGLGNFVVSTVELLSSTVLAFIAMAMPVVIGVLLLIVAFFVVRRLLRRRRENAAVTIVMPQTTRSWSQTA